MNASSGDLRSRAAEVLSRIAAEKENPIWIQVATEEEVFAQVVEVEEKRQAGKPLPLYGHFFAVKDNIDVAGVPTTAGCPDYAYVPDEDAPVVKKAKEAGAIYLGKTNMDQFATGLVGTRSPHGACRNAFNSDFISGGSSSGSAVAVAKQQATFSFGTDTAGSGRVPAAFNGLVGYKPTKGLLSTRGVVPACRSLDCVSVFAADVESAAAVAEVVTGWDKEDPFSRKKMPTVAFGRKDSFRFGVPKVPVFFGDREAEGLYQRAITQLESVGGVRVEIDFEPFAAAAGLLYQGPWVAERYAAVGEWMEAHPDSCDPTVLGIITSARELKAVDVFRSFYRLEELRRDAEKIWQQMDVLFLPTAPTVYRIAEVEADPVVLNSRLGTYTNFVNLLDLCALALPAGKWESGVPFGVTLMAPAFADEDLFALGHRFLGEEQSSTAPARDDSPVSLAVVGAHLQGQPLHHQLTSRNAEFVARTRTAPCYRLYALAGTQPPKPGLIRSKEGGAAIEVEVYRLSKAAFGDFVSLVPPPLSIGTLELADGSRVKGFLCESIILESAEEITKYGAWLAYLEDQSRIQKA